MMGKDGDIVATANIIIINGNSTIDRDCEVKEGKKIEIRSKNNNINGDIILNKDSELNLKPNAKITLKKLKLKHNGKIVLEDNSDLEILGETESHEAYKLGEGRTLGMNVYYNEETKNSRLIGNLGVISSSGKIKQNNLLGNISADVDSKLLTLGLNIKSKKTYKKIIPYAGLHYARLETDSFETKIAGGKMYDTNCDVQNMFLVPIGLIYEEGIESKYGRIVPSLKLELLTVFGDKSTNNKVNINGVNASDTISSNMIDSNSLVGNLGVGLERENMSYGVRYQMRTSSKLSSNNIGLNFEYQL